VRTSENKSPQKRLGLICGLVYDPRGLSGVTTAKPGVPGVLHPVDPQAKLVDDSGPPVADASQFRSIVGALKFLTFTRPDITYAVQKICLHMHDPREPHLTAMKRILRYLRGTPDFGLLLRRSSSSDMVIYTNADWAGCADTRRSTSGYAVFLGDNLVCQAANCRLLLQRQSRVPCRRQ
jgi:hypothetical protein